MRILIVDDERVQRETLGAILSDRGYDVVVASGVIEAKSKISAQVFDIILSDFKMPDGTGVQVVEYARKFLPEALAFIMTAYADVNSIIESMRLGVLDYLLKPINVENLLGKLSLLSERLEMQQELQDLRSRLNRQEGGMLLGESEGVGAVRKMIDQVAETKGTVLITGESGTGKEVAARLIHARSADSNKKFVAINCAAIPENLLESELFGHKKGSFTGAVADKDGLFKIANGGTVFLDEVGELPKSLQAKLLRVLQEREMTPVGDVKPIKIDIRLIAATNRDLSNEVTTGAFRQDLFYRINVVQIIMPALREHIEDVPMLAWHFLDKYVKQFNKRPMRMSNDALRALMEYHWPGNVRELENVIERAIILGPNGGVIELENLPPTFQAMRLSASADDSDSPLSLDVAVSAFSRRHILKVLETTQFDKKEAAKCLGLSLSSLYRKMDDLGLPMKGLGEAAKL